MGISHLIVRMDKSDGSWHNQAPVSVQLVLTVKFMCNVIWKTKVMFAV